MRKLIKRKIEVLKTYSAGYDRKRIGDIEDVNVTDEFLQDMVNYGLWKHIKTYPWDQKEFTKTDDLNPPAHFIIKEGVLSFRLFREANAIKWVSPNVNDELGEYFENKYTKNYFARKGLQFKKEEDLKSFLDKGKLVSITKKQLESKYDNLTLDPADFKDEMSDSEYAKSYKDMESKLVNGITLPAPIIIKFEDTYYGFAGNRRINLAFNNNLPLKVWLINANI